MRNLREQKKYPNKFYCSSLYLIFYLLILNTIFYKKIKINLKIKKKNF